ncbi:MAG: 3-oxoacyl-[acyl-carrier protein] reductase [Rhodothermales bacterium]|jgi:3-oxoacyl-[acyl-carrier protein] reductase
MATSLDGHVALVTGSSKGLGKGIAAALGEAGAKVVLNYCHGKEAGEQAYEELKAAGCDCILVRANVVDADSIATLVSEVAARFGAIDILVPNATPAQPQRPIEEYSWDDYQAMIDFFIKSPYLLTRAILPGMKAKKWGRIVNIGSEVFQRGVGNFSAYVAAKGGQAGWTRSMASELAPFGITVNLVAPGWIPVERHADDPQADKDEYFASIPVGRWGIPADIGNAVNYLASEESSFVTGQTLCVNGGLTPL